MLAPSLRLFERSLNFTYRLAFFEGFSVTDDGTEVQQASHGASGSRLLDFTDDVIDPRRGFRIGYTTSLTAPGKSLLGRNSEPVELLGESVRGEALSPATLVNLQVHAVLNSSGTP